MRHEARIIALSKHSSANKCILCPARSQEIPHIRQTPEQQYDYMLAKRIKTKLENNKAKLHERFNMTAAIIC